MDAVMPTQGDTAISGECGVQLTCDAIRFAGCARNKARLNSQQICIILGNYDMHGSCNTTNNTLFPCATLTTQN